ncbi:RNA-binding S4 domain-containing protein [Mycoplasma corogypsi]|uniref:RNA-binding S4 domain-containing protein n=1 Tax=Mycoplasma corogypsi TaxID=2106 RepID=UPI00387345D9
MIKVTIKGKEIKLGQFLKKVNETPTGGAAKWFLSNNKIKINNEIPQGRSAKIHPGDIVWVNNTVYKIESEDEE